MLPAPPVMPGGALAAVEAGGLTFNPVPRRPGQQGRRAVAACVVERWSPASRTIGALDPGNGKLRPNCCKEVAEHYVIPKTCLIAACSLAW